MSRFWLGSGGSVLLVLAAQRCFFLASSRAGWLMYLANVVSEIVVKKAGLSRGAGEAALAGVGLAGLWLGGLGWGWMAAVVLGALALELYARRVERRLLTTVYAQLDRIGASTEAGQAGGALAVGYPFPSTHPELTINLTGPFVERMPGYRLGTLVVGREFDLRLVIGNHTIVPTQTGVRVKMTAPASLACEQDAGELVPRLKPGEVHELKRRWKVNTPAGAGAIEFKIEWGHFSRRMKASYDACVAADGLRAARVSITRYPGACRSAFAWRGDMDLYDESTLQSIEGLEVTFGLAARYRVPQTMYLSTRLALVEPAARAWADHYGIDRGAGRIADFIEWTRRHVEFRHRCGYPFQSDKGFVVELGNHGHLHYGTETSGASENQWRLKARMGAGVYPWVGEDRSSFGEQRDNALEARRWCEQTFGFTPKSWAMPDRTNDPHTAAAMEAAGCEVLSGSNTTPRSNVLLQPPPHHPGGTCAVELTNRYPGDPQHVFHWAMVTFWLHRSHRRGIPMIFMCHQHMRQFHGHACSRFTESILQQALHCFHGDLHVNTLFGVGKYWREVLSPQTARVRVSVESGRVLIENPSDVDFAEVPVDVKAGAVGFTLLVNVCRGTRCELDLATGAVIAVGPLGDQQAALRDAVASGDSRSSDRGGADLS